MNLYICLDGSFAGTQADAKAKGKGFTPIDVPTDKAGLIAFLNSMVDEHRAVNYEAPEAPAPQRLPYHTVEQSENQRRQWNADAIVEFILDDASVNDAANILSSLGTRFGELAKERRA